MQHLYSWPHSLGHTSILSVLISVTLNQSMYTNNLLSTIILEIPEGRDLHFSKLLKALGYFPLKDYSSHYIKWNHAKKTQKKPLGIKAMSIYVRTAQLSHWGYNHILEK